MNDQFTEPASSQPPVATETSAPITPDPQPMPPSAPKASPKNSHKKKTAIFTIITLILIAAAAYGAYQIEHSRAMKTERNQQAQIDSLKKQIKSLQKPAAAQSKVSNSAYAGWKSYTLQNEKLTFLYPPNWAAGPWPAATPSATQDLAVLAANDGFKCTIEDGISNRTGSGSLVSGSPISLTYMGKPAYFVFLNPKPAGSTTADTSKVEGAILLTNPNDASSLLLGKYAVGTSTAPGANNGKYISFACNLPSPISLQQLQQNPMVALDYKNAKLVVESMHY